VTPAGFLEISDWFSCENQGCGIASTEVDGVATLVAFLVDAGIAGNRDAYRIGSGVDPVSAAAATWGPWLDIPDWCPWQNEGADITVADITGNGKPDLIVLLVDAPDGQNSGFYRVGRDLDNAGQVSGSWTQRLAVSRTPCASPASLQMSINQLQLLVRS
jgi:hypothetical protein